MQEAIEVLSRHAPWHPSWPTQATLPLPPSHWLARERLWQVLDEASDHAVTLVAAPAGYGKSSLVSEWLRVRQRPFAWTTFDRRDDDPARVWARMLVCIDESLPDASIRLATEGAESTDDAISTVLTRLAAASTPPTLVLDDLDVVASDPARDLLRYVLTRVSSLLPVILVTRADPLYLPISRWRWRGHLAEVRAADLAFTPDETAAYLAGAWGLGLSHEQADAVGERVDGWPAALHLAAAHLSRHPEADPSSALDDRTLAAEMLEDVLDDEDPDQATFLRQTSILDHLTPGLCRAATGVARSEILLARLAERGLLLRTAGRPGSDAPGYRHHRLLGDLLRAELLDRMPREAEVLHGRAARWLADHDAPEAAVRHGLAARADGFVLDLVGDHLWEVVGWDGGTTLRQVVGGTAALDPHRHRALLSTYIDLALLAGDADAIATLMARLGSGGTQGSVLVRRAQLSLVRLRGDDADATADPTATIHLMDPVHTHALGAQRGREGRHHEAATLLRAAADRAARDGARLRQLAILADLSWERVEAGCLVEAALLVPRVRGLADELGVAPPSAGQLAATRLALDRGLDPHATIGATQDVREWGDDPLRLAWALLALRRDSGGRVSNETVHRYLEIRSQEDVARWGVSLVHRAARIEAAMRLAIGDVEGAVLAVPDVVGAGHPASLSPTDQLLLARLWHARGRTEDAWRLVTEVERHEPTPRTAMGAARLKATLARQRGDESAARAAAARALWVAGSQGMRAVPSGRTLNSRGTAAGSVSLASVSTAPHARKGTGPCEPLTTREQDVLNLLDSELTYNEIATTLHVSTNTVKTHLKATYRKLDVSSRSQAVDRAQRCGLMGSPGLQVADATASTPPVGTVVR